MKPRKAADPSTAAISNPSRLSQRGTGAVDAEKELALNTGVEAPEVSGKSEFATPAVPGKGTMTLDQLERGLGIRATHVPAGVSDVVPSDAMTFKDESGKTLSFAQVMGNVHTFLDTANTLAETMQKAGLPLPARSNPVEAAIAYVRNVEGKSPTQSLAALETDLVKISVLGFQIGTDRDRKTMAGLESLVGSLAQGLEKNRDLRGTTAVFELGIRKLPEGVPYLAIAGVREAIDYVYNQLDFNEETIQFLKNEVPATKGWTEEQWNYLRNFKDEVKKLKITGLPDGSIYTGGPILKVEGPPLVAEFIESAVMARVSAMTSKATAVAMVKDVFKGKFAELGARRPPSADSLTKDIEAGNVVADLPTSLVYAQYLNGIKALGTMEHSAIMLNGTDRQTEFFVQWFLMYGEFSAALIDSKTPKEGVESAIKAQKIIDKLKPQLEKDPAYAHIKNWKIPAVRLDSGDLKKQVIQFRKMLDDAGMQGTEIFIMDGMTADKLKKIVYNDDGTEVKVDSTGSGESLRFPTAMNDEGQEYHWLPQMIYKASRLYTEDESLDLMKLSATPDKATRPARSLHRVFGADGKMLTDIAGLQRHDGTYETPAAPPGGKVVDRLVVLAENGVPDPVFSLPDQEYWKGTRSRFADEAHALPTDWRQRDALRAEGKDASIPYDETDELLGAVRQGFVDAGRGQEFADWEKAKGGA